MTENRIAEMIQRLSALATGELTIEDQGHLHVGHDGAKGGGGHFMLRIVSDQFAGMPPLQRQRAVYAALGDMLHKEIHALQIQALSPREAANLSRHNATTARDSTSACTN